MAAPKGNKFAPGGRREGAGRPSKDKQTVKMSLLLAVQKMLEEKGDELSKVYHQMALKDPATMRHAIDKIMPPAKQTVEVEGVLTIVHKTNLPE